MTPRQSRLLAEWRDGPLGHELLSLWEHARQCKICFDEIENFRTVILSRPGKTFPLAQYTFEDIRAKMETGSAAVAVPNGLSLPSLNFTLAWIDEQLKLFLDNQSEKILASVPVRGTSIEYSESIDLELEGVTLMLRIKAFDPKENSYSMSIAIDEKAESGPRQNLRVEIEHSQKGLVYSKGLWDKENDIPPLAAGHYALNLLRAREKIGTVQFVLKS